MATRPTAANNNLYMKSRWSPLAWVSRRRPTSCRPVFWWALVGIIATLTLGAFIAACVWAFYFTLFPGQFHG
jgi:hypothetical protein